MVLILCAPLLAAGGWLVGNDADVQAGQDAYEAGQYERAAAAFRKARGGRGDSDVVQFDLGTTLAKQSEMATDTESKKRLSRVAVATLKNALDSKDDGLRSDAHFNLGNALVLGQRYDEAIDSYKMVLRLTPANEAARYNLELAQLLRRRGEATTEPITSGAGPESSAQTSAGPDGVPADKTGSGQAGANSASSQSGDSLGAGPGVGDGTVEQGTEQPAERGPAMRAEPRTMAAPGSADARAVQQKLDALERRSGELRRSRVLRKTRNRLRSPSNVELVNP